MYVEEYIRCVPTLESLPTTPILSPYSKSSQNVHVHAFVGFLCFSNARLLGDFSGLK